MSCVCSSRISSNAAEPRPFAACFRASVVDIVAPEARLFLLLFQDLLSPIESHVSFPSQVS